MARVDLLKNYPKAKRNISGRAARKTERVRAIARRFDKDYFDGDRAYGYGGYNYHPKFWENVVSDFQTHYGLSPSSNILDVGCAKGFMLYDFMRLIPGLTVAGIDISHYALSHAQPQVKPYLIQGSADALPFADKSFDLVISINTIHNLPLTACKKALKEIQRVSRKNAFITVDAYTKAEEKKRLEMWNLTALTYMQDSDWIELFHEVGYTGDYDWFIP